jgi:cytochrome P450
MFPEIYGHHRNFVKGRAYDAMRVQPVPSVFNATSNELHSQRRKIISQGFSDAALKSCEPTILKHIAKYCEVLFGQDIPSSDGWTDSKNLTTWSEYDNYWSRN